eukprot:sb/3473712/
MVSQDIHNILKTSLGDSYSDIKEHMWNTIDREIQLAECSFYSYNADLDKNEANTLLLLSSPSVCPRLRGRNVLMAYTTAPSKKRGKTHKTFKNDSTLLPATATARVKKGQCYQTLKYSRTVELIQPFQSCFFSIILTGVCVYMWLCA